MPGATAPSKEEYDIARISKHGERVNEVLKGSTVGIAGLGGLGSNIAVMAARMGIGKLIIADFDVVDLPNMNRQNFYFRHIGMKKTDATVEILNDVCPHQNIESHSVKLTPDNIKDIFNECDLVFEALDSASAKAMLINSLLIDCPRVKVVSGSGLGGYGNTNLMKTNRIFERLFICGDGVDFSERESILMSPRVNLCAAQMANTAVAILMDEEV